MRPLEVHKARVYENGKGKSIDITVKRGMAEQNTDDPTSTALAISDLFRIMAKGYKHRGVIISEAESQI
ncbi:MAG: hypothetical protein M1834_002494 [Cirrosporium novae-zelandiae]|nr:MAG: hypothetical protein M1834_002494 [Cirrosporium novae-zelandiae]